PRPEGDVRGQLRHEPLTPAEAANAVRRAHRRPPALPGTPPTLLDPHPRLRRVLPRRWGGESLSGWVLVQALTPMEAVGDVVRLPRGPHRRIVCGKVASSPE